MSEIGLKDLILIGHVIRPQGLTGLLRIVSYAQSSETFLKAGSVFLNKDKKDLYESKVISIRTHGTAYLLRLSTLKSIDQAEVFRGAEILIKKDCLIKKDENEFFYYELLGLDIYLITGQYLGVLKEIFSTRSNDVYIVRNQGKEFLIPAVYEVIKEINIPQKRMVILPIKGLLDL